MRPRCSRCGSQKGIVEAEVGHHKPYVRVDARPEALLRKKTVTRTLRARVCGACGAVDLYVDDPEELLLADRERGRPARKTG